MYLIKQNLNNKIFYLNILIMLFPLSLIIGNLATNINILCIVFFGVYTYKKDTFVIQEKHIQNLIYLFFLYLVLVTFFNNFPMRSDNFLYKEHIFKSIFYLRFLILYLVINKLIEKNQLNYKNLIYSIIFFVSLIAFDLIFQLIFGKNLIGLEIKNFKISSFFGDEQIAGGYLQKFSLFFIFYFITKIKNNTYQELFTLISISLFFFLIILAGNRMPAFIFILIFLLYYLIEKKFKSLLISLIFFFSIIFFLLNNPMLYRVDAQLKKFYYKSVEIITLSPKLFYYDEYPDKNLKLRKRSYLAHFNTGIQLWKKNKFFGSGLKSFKINSTFGRNLTKNVHPHNYFIEILLDTGLVGILIIYSLIFIGIKNFIKNYRENFYLSSKKIFLPFFLIIFFEFLPFRSTGSFFTTSNSSYIFFLLPFFLNSYKLQDMAKSFNIK